MIVAHNKIIYFILTIPTLYLQYYILFISLGSDRLMDIYTSTFKRSTWVQSPVYTFGALKVQIKFNYNFFPVWRWLYHQKQQGWRQVDGRSCYKWSHAATFTFTATALHQASFLSLQQTNNWKRIPSNILFIFTAFRRARYRKAFESYRAASFGAHQPNDIPACANISMYEFPRSNRQIKSYHCENVLPIFQAEFYADFLLTGIGCRAVLVQQILKFKATIIL